jgi:hypothetical protein
MPLIIDHGFKEKDIDTGMAEPVAGFAPGPERGRFRMLEGVKKKWPALFMKV